MIAALGITITTTGAMPTCAGRTVGPAGLAPRLMATTS
jgi:hypothetical protein